MEKIKIFSGGSHPELAEKVCKNLGVSIGRLKIEEFRNGCFELSLEEDVKNSVVFLFQTSRQDDKKLHKDIWEIFQMVNAAKNCKAKKIIVVMPYVSYARSDKIHTAGMAIYGKLLIQLLECGGMTGFIGIDFHSYRFENFFLSKVYQVSALDLLAEPLKKLNPKKTFILPGDMGAFKKSSILAKKLKIPIGQVKKERVNDTEVKIKSVTGNFANKDVLIFDDEISTGTTLKTLAKEIQNKAKSISFVVTHGLFVGSAVKNFQEIEKLKEIIITDTVPISEELKKSLPLKILSVDKILAKKIKEIAKLR